MKKLLLFLSICWLHLISVSAQNCQADFQFNSTNLTVTFTDSSYYSPNVLFAIQDWNFGDGNVGSGTNPVHTYAAAGTYSTCLTIYDSLFSCFDTICKVITISGNTNPASCQADFYFSANGLTVQFFDSSITNMPINYDWNFGDGNIGSGSNPTHGYVNAGTYTACLTIYDSSLTCFDTICKSVNVSAGTPPCNSNFTYNVNPTNSVSFTLSISGGTAPYAFSWDFGDGSAYSTAQNPTHHYNSNGSYIVTVTSTDANGVICTFSDTVIINIPPPCKAEFSYNLTGKLLDITNRVGNYNTILYDLGDGSMTSVPNPSYQYMTDGIYIVSQTITTSIGCSDVFYDTIVVQTTPPCQAGFSYTTSDLRVDFNDQSQNASNISYDFDDGNSSNSPNPSYTYANSGTYIVCQTVTNLNNCSSSFCDTITVTLPLPCLADFTYTTVNDTTRFTNLSQQFTRVVYDFGDGTSSMLKNPIHEYINSGTYQVSLIIHNDSTYCSDTLMKSVTVTISKSCVAQFELALDTNQKSVLYLVNTSSSDNTHSYFWDFGDGNTSTDRLPVHGYSQNKAYSICLTVSDSVQNCTSTYCDSVGLDSNGNILKSAGFSLKVLDGSFIGIDESQSFENSISVYPNPFTNQLNIEINSELNKVEYLLFNTKGEIVKQSQFTAEFNTLNLPELPPGMYFLKLQSSGRSSVKRIVKF